MHLQFLENGHGEEMVNGLDEGLMRVSSIMDSESAESVAPPTTCPHIPLTESPDSGQEYRTAGRERPRNTIPDKIVTVHHFIVSELIVASYIT